MFVARPNDDYGNQEHRSAPMEMSRRGFLMSSLASITLIPRAVVAASEDLVGTPPENTNLNRHNSTAGPSKARSRAAASRNYNNRDAYYDEDFDGTGPSKPKKIKVKDVDEKGKRVGGTPKPPRIKGVARSELFLKVSEALV